jgi:sec-independent protein translocase protein TatB
MFDIGFFEMLVVAIVALLVIGPERLPKVARTAGKWVGRVRRFVSDVKQDIDKELRTEELRQAIDNDASLDELKKIIHGDGFTIEDEEENKMHPEADKGEDQQSRKQQQLEKEQQYEEFDDDIDYGLSDHSDYGEPQAPDNEQAPPSSGSEQPATDEEEKEKPSS